MKKLLHYELYKAIHRGLTYVIICVCCGIGLLFSSQDYINNPIVPGTPNSVTGIYMNEVADAGIAMIILIGCYIVFSFGNDLKKRCMNFEILSGNGRNKVFCSHYLFAFFFSGTVIAAASVIGCCKYGIGDWFIQIIKDKSYFLRSILFIYLLSSAMISLCIMFAVLFRDTAKSTIAAFVYLFISCYIMAALTSPGSDQQLSSAYENASGMLLLYPAYLWRWVLNPNLSGIQILFAILIGLLWCGISFFVSSYLFCRMELN